MKKRILSGICFLLLTWIFYFNAQAQKNYNVPSIVNSAHLDSLYEEIQVANNTIGIIHIYSEYPDYKWVDDSDEGIACVDDAARAAIFYMEYFESNDDESSLFRAKKLLEFIFYMQSDNGFFYNFIFEDYSINEEHKNSVAEPNWWSWRAMWALSEGYKIFKNNDPEFTELIISHLSKAIDVTKGIIPDETKLNVIDGISFPTWLPGEAAGDQASVLILALLNYLEEKTDTLALRYLNLLCDGILQMQKGDSASIPHYAFLSWQNIWHAYGNSQSYSLLKASSFLKREDLFKAAKNEINYFYNYLIEEKHLSYFALGFDNDHSSFTDKQKFSQIAYNFRPMIYACLEAFKITGDTVYAKQAGEIASWFFGNNVANEQIYFPSTGICYDGINSEDNVNNNSGAESTIEALLALLAVEKNTISKNFINKIICKKYYENN